MSTKPCFLALLSALALASPSCDSPGSPSGSRAKIKPGANHHATATLEIHDISSYQPGQERATSNNFLNNQIAIISANSVMEEAAKEVGVDLKVIKDALWIEAIEGTDLINLSAFHDDQAMSKRIAESVIATYVARLNRLAIERATTSLEALDNEITNQGDLVQDHRKELTVLIQQYGIPYFDGRTSNPVGTTEEEMYRFAQKKLDDAETQKNLLTIQIEKLINTSNEDLVRSAAGLDLPENRVSIYYQSFRDSIDEVDGNLAAGLEKNHPSIIALRQKADLALEHARAEVVTLKKVLQTKLQLIDQSVEKMRETVNRKQDNTVELSLKQHNYNQAKEDYEQSRDMYREMKLKQQEARVLLKMPRTPVTIHGWEYE